MSANVMSNDTKCLHRKQHKKHDESTVYVVENFYNGQFLQYNILPDFTESIILIMSIYYVN